MTSSAPRTWANSGSEPKLRGAGQPAGPSGPVRAAAATTPGAALEIAGNASPAKASKTAARSRPRVTILTTPPAPIDDPSGLATPGLAGHGHAEPSPPEAAPAENDIPKTAAGHPAEKPIPRSMLDRLAATVHDSRAPRHTRPPGAPARTWPPQRTPAVRTNVPARPRHGAGR